MAPTVGPRRTEADGAAPIAHPIATAPEAPWLLRVDPLPTQKSEALGRLVASPGGIAADLGEKEKRGIGPSMPTRATFWREVNPRIRCL